MTHFEWQENIVVVDAAHVDRVAFNLIVNFERMLGRRIPQADMARWTECIALDGGLREGENQTQVVLVHDKGYRTMANFVPGSLDNELNGKAFKSHLGEFEFHTLTGEDIAGVTEVMADLVANISQEPKVKRLMVVADEEDAALMGKMRQALQQADADKRITLFMMQPIQGGNYRQEMLGYSLLNALGINSEEINSKMK